MEKVFLINVFVTASLFLDVSAYPAKPNCPPDKPKVYCFVDPCDESSCVVRGASCLSYSCGGCQAIWSDSSGGPLDNDQCTRLPPTTTTATTTPKITAATTPTTTATTTPKITATTTPKTANTNQTERITTTPGPETATF